MSFLAACPYTPVNSEDEGHMDLEVLRKAPLFTNLDDEVFSALTSELTEVELSRGASAFHEGDQGDQLYVIMSGKIKLGRTAPDGRENLLAILGPGEVFGEMALFNPAPRTASATAVSATRLAGLRHDNLRKVIQSTPEVSMQLLRALAQRLSKTNESLADLVFSDVPGRVAKALLDLADRFGRPAADGLLVAHDLTQEELAQLVGASRETVNKALAEFVQRGWIRLENRAVVVLDLQRLRQRSR
jgi:CRP/FNR family transcriptional regulator, cyclic AMP receptor protein